MILDSSISSGVLQEAETLTGFIVACDANNDTIVLSTLTDSSWAWSLGTEVSGTQVEGTLIEPQGEVGDWEGTFVELDIEATTPEGRIDDYDPTSDSGDLALMKNFPDQG